MKKRFALLIALCMLLALLPVPASAANVIDAGTCGEHAEWIITDDGVMTISGTGVVTAPELPEEMLAELSDIHTLVIREGIHTIAENAFSNRGGARYSFRSIVLPNSLKIIGIDAFMQETQLTEIRFGTGLETIESSAFYGCSALQDLTLPNSLKLIGSGAFYGCSALETLVIPGSVRQIGTSAFSRCTGLKSAILEDGVELLDDYVFGGCSALERVILPDTVRSRFMGTFSGCTALKSVRIPVQTSVIEVDAFLNCRSLEYVILPDAVRWINCGAFANTRNLTDLYYAGTVDQLRRMRIDEISNEQLEYVAVHLIPCMPDPVFGFYDLPEPDSWAYPGIAFCLENGLMNGMGDGYFQPSGTTTRAQLVTILWRMMGEPEASDHAPFTDLTQDWYAKAVAWAAENEITNGTSKTTFSPDAPVTREQMVTIFYRMCRDYLEFDVSLSAALDSFPDSASVSPWAQDAMQWAVAVKLISGVGDGNGHAALQPQSSATRAQIATVMWNFFSAFSDT